ncbi:GD13095 [Drosophila simulans]|uniref:GD13095 n=1 Tax=Drosophila simulans TaxID=7240 RepID=B4QJW7_DROSI|nr:GD13095 [Drosophila simulans]
MCVIEITDGQGAAGRNDGRIRDQTPSNCISQPTPLCLPSNTYIVILGQTRRARWSRRTHDSGQAVDAWLALQPLGTFGPPGASGSRHSGGSLDKWKRKRDIQKQDEKSIGGDGALRKGRNVAGSDREINHISGRAYNVSCVLRATNLRLQGKFYTVYGLRLQGAVFGAIAFGAA